MNTQNNNIGKRLTLYQMLNDQEDYVEKILIPKMQRDYAQGRVGMESLRARFLGSLFGVIDKDPVNKLVLDFVFGQKEPQNRIFYPVDGQQRITTLFLLHLYIGKLAHQSIDFLKKFSYETRTSSKQFCERLHDIPDDAFKGIKAYIEDQWWFTGLWRTDPTIMSMLNMLNDIDNHYTELGYEERDFQKAWGRLIENVEFWLLYLSDLDTTDELYITMNSRGKALTDFEHFKAMLDEYAKTQGVLSQKVDTDWTNLLWRYRNPKQDYDEDKYTQNGLDQCFYNLLFFYLRIEGCKRELIEYDSPEYDIITLADKVLGFHVDPKEQLDESEIDKKRIQKEKETKDILNRFECILDFFSEKDGSGALIHDPQSFFDNYIQKDYDHWPLNYTDLIIPNRIKVIIGTRTDCDLLKEVCEKGKLKNEATIYTEAFFEYAANFHAIDEDVFLDRLRKLRNLVENTEIHARTFRETLLVTDHIVSSGNLFMNSINDEFNNIQKQQEADKDNWMLNHHNEAALLKMLENHWLLLGNLNMVMKKDSLGYRVIDVTALQRFGLLFNSKCDYSTIELALLTEGDYSSPSRSGVKAYGGSEWGRWKDITQSNNDITPKVLQQFLSKYSDYSQSNLNAIIDSAINSPHKTYTWTYYLLKYSSMRTAPRAKYRYLNGHYSHTMLNANGGGGSEYYWNPYNFALGAELKDVGIDNTVDSNGGPLVLSTSGIKVDIKENTIEFEFSDPNIPKKDVGLPQDLSSGIDTTDRIQFAITECKNILSQI